MKRLTVHTLGQLAQADLQFGDMTVLIGPQASGKSLFLQSLKLVLDCGDITKTIKKHGFDWRGIEENFLSLYYGEGMQGVWGQDTLVAVDGQRFELKQALAKTGRKKAESLFYIPAQRVLTIGNGWPRPFTAFEAGDPFVVKQFSESLRQLMEAGLGSGQGPIFPQVGRLNKKIREMIQGSIFHNVEVRLDRTGMRKRIVLQVNDSQLPFMTWSAGQREFIPLLLGLYWLLPSSKLSKRQEIEWVVIEEPEAGLHPQAISAVLFTLLELIHRGYKVVVSTHAPQVLEMIWAIRMLQSAKAGPDSLLRLFGLKDRYLEAHATHLLTDRRFCTYYFERAGDTVSVKDISALDPASLYSAVADWGGLTTFSTTASEVVSEAATDSIWDS